MARYIGGPCDGQTVIDIRPATRSCGGVTYTRAGLDYYAPGTVPKAEPFDGKQVGRAWHKLTRVFSTEVPAAVRRSKAGSARLRKLSR